MQLRAKIHGERLEGTSLGLDGESRIADGENKDAETGSAKVACAAGTVNATPACV